MENQENKNSLECNTIELDSWDKKTGRKHIKSVPQVNPLGVFYLFIIILAALGLMFHVSSSVFMLGFYVAFYSSIGVTYLLNKKNVDVKQVS